MDMPEEDMMYGGRSAARRSRKFRSKSRKSRSGSRSKSRSKSRSRSASKSAWMVHLKKVFAARKARGLKDFGQAMKAAAKTYHRK